MQVGICAIVRDEATYVEEWVAFHRAQGVGIFQIYDNGSVDGTPDVLRRVGLEPIIWAGRPADFDTQQRAAYLEAAHMLAGRAEWLAFIDIDEFLFGRGMPLTAALAGFAGGVGAIAVQQVMFGSGGQRTRLPGPVTQRFTRCAPRDHGENRWFKTVARPEWVAGFESVHSVMLSEGTYVMPDGSPLERGAQSGEAVRRVEGRLGLHHYALKSLEEFRAKQAKWSDRLAAARMSDGYFFGRDGHCSLEECRELADLPLPQAGTARQEALPVAPAPAGGTAPPLPPYLVPIFRS